jgi:hypothetical protein
MSYGYDGPEYADYGAYDDGYNEYADSYSDHGDPYSDCGDPYPDCAESVYNDPDPTHSEPDHYGDHENAPEGYEYEQEGEVERHEGEELERGEDGIDEYEEERYESEGLEHEGNQEYEGEEPVYEPEHDAETRHAETGYAEHEPHGFEYNEYKGEYTPHPHFPPFPNPSPTPYAHNPPRSNQRGHVTASVHHTYVFDDGHDDDKPRGFERDGTSEHEEPTYHNTGTANGAPTPTQLIYLEELGEYVHPCFLTPAQIAHHHNTLEHPLTPHPTPIPSARDSPDSNQQGHVTASGHHAYASNNGYGNEHESADANNGTAKHPTDHTTPPIYTNLDTLRRDYNDGVPEAITYMRGLQEYSDECLHGVMEEEKQEEAKYTLEHPSSPPPKPTAIDNNKPDHIEVSRPLFAQPKCRRRKKYAKRRPIPTPTHHLNNNPTPYPTSRLRPPPWPNKNPDRKHHDKHRYNKHPPVSTTTKRRPPPWPIFPTLTPILSIGSSRPPPWPNIRHRRRKKYSPISATPPACPPPWPIISHCIHPTPQNRRNAKRRIKAQSRSISDEVSF